LQTISKNPRVLLDAAHNPHGARSLAHSLVNSFNSPHAIGVISVLGDKDVKGVLVALETVLSEVFITQSSSNRATEIADLALLATEVFGSSRVQVTETLEQALELASAKALQVTGGTVVVTGSITLVGDVMKLKQKEVDRG
jgi:dihydrofolate synthase/folylpolyglutamate synthase